MTKATPGDTVKVACKLDAAGHPGQRRSEPLELQFTIGEKRVFQGLENAVIGMEPGETKTERLPPSQAFGDRKPELIFPLPSSQIPEGLDPQVGQSVQLTYKDGTATPARVVEKKADGVVVDANHPLAGEEVLLEVTLVAFAA